MLFDGGQLFRHDAAYIENRPSLVFDLQRVVA